MQLTGQDLVCDDEFGANESAIVSSSDADDDDRAGDHAGDVKRHRKRHQAHADKAKATTLRGDGKQASVERSTHESKANTLRDNKTSRRSSNQSNDGKQMSKDAATNEFAANALAQTIANTLIAR